MHLQETSRAAKASVDHEAVRGRVLRYIRERREFGATCDEVEDKLGLLHQTASATIRALVQDGKLRNSLMRRYTRSGRQAIVWLPC